MRRFKLLKVSEKTWQLRKRSMKKAWKQEKTSKIKLMRLQRRFMPSMRRTRNIRIACSTQSRNYKTNSNRPKRKSLDSRRKCRIKHWLFRYKQRQIFSWMQLFWNWNNVSKRKKMLRRIWQLQMRPSKLWRKQTQKVKKMKIKRIFFSCLS